ncbi:structural maintenance of chromosomes protein 2 [Euwallacea fornicatus]|uniref:structural maintenance of chromosomes protein 2 n=1 Tax=Euwallacea fornicatus TaxID=995702 RepID=UPI00338F072B
MYIKSIVLDGFKSYGQRTEVTEFDPLFNAITGLNGSGKSNILDSICFVLGISNLTHVRANSLQDLIYKSGQAGINKATVSITFDNTNLSDSPPGFDSSSEITISRQIALGGKNKYLINGINVTSRKVQDLFCSVHLNVNNPHFLIMQGQITKVLNMKPPEILSMVEEAAGTRMYETKRLTTQKLIQKKDAKLSEFQQVICDELSPRLQKLKAEREQYFAYQRIERELEHLMGIYQVWQYFEAKSNLDKAEEELKQEQQKIEGLNEKILANTEDVTRLDEEIKAIVSNNESESSIELQEMEAKLKEKETEEAKINASVKAIKDHIATEEKAKLQLERTIVKDEKALKTREDQLSQVQSLFEKLKENDRLDSEACALAEQKYEALCIGMEVNDEGETQTLGEQLMKAKEDASKASTEQKQAVMQLTSCENQLKQKSKETSANSTEYEKEKASLRRTEQEVAQLEASIKRLNFSEDRMKELNGRRRALLQETHNIRDQVEQFEGSRPHTSFKYRDPETNFNRNSVKGVVCKLFTYKDEIYATALESAAGGKLYNVVVDTDMTSKKLLQRGDLQTRTTFIPLNKISSYRMDEQIIKLAENLVGKENCQPALSLINYDRSLQAAMEYIFGDIFICRDINVAKTVTFHDRIRKRCVTLDGDSTDPGGTLSGGARQKGESILKLIQNIKKLEVQLKDKERELAQVDGEMRQMNGVQEQYNSIKYKLDMSKHELGLIQGRLLNTTFARQQDEVDNLKSQIDELKAKLATCKEIERESVTKVKDLESKMKDSSGYQAKRLKEAEAALQAAKAKAEKSNQEWRQREQEYGILTVEIEELKKGIQETSAQLTAIIDSIKRGQEEHTQASEESAKLKETVKELQLKIKNIKSSIAQKNKEVQNKIKQKEELLTKNTDLELEIKKHSHEINELTGACKTSQRREQEYLKKIGKNNTYLQKGQALSQKEGLNLERNIKVAQEKKHTLGRTVNAQAQSMFEVEEKRFDEIVGKQKIVENDKNKLMKMITELDAKKENVLKLAYEQVSKDFGSIFATLLPGANAKLLPMQGKSILQGLEIKVSLGNVWKESLTELSGGQRSLAALSLILAMLLFKPAPLYILDEVDAALDLSHTQNIGRMLKSHFKKSQFIVVSLKDGMFNNANVLFRTKFMDGVSMVQRTENRKQSSH